MSKSLAETEADMEAERADWRAKVRRCRRRRARRRARRKLEDIFATAVTTAADPRQATGCRRPLAEGQLIQRRLTDDNEGCAASVERERADAAEVSADLENLRREMTEKMMKVSVGVPAPRRAPTSVSAR